MREQIRGLIFDKDGTLFDYQATWGGWTARFIEGLADGDARAARALAQALGFDLQAARFAKSSPMIAGTMEVFVAAVARTLPHVHEEHLRQHMLTTSAVAALVEATPLRPLFDQLWIAGLTLGLATNDSEAPALAQLARAGVLDRFAFVAGYDSGYGAKPAPGMLRAFCQSTGLAPGAVAMIGDSVHDLDAGRAAGMRTVAVLTGPAEAVDLAPHADIVLPDIGALPDWLGLHRP